MRLLLLAGLLLPPAPCFHLVNQSYEVCAAYYWNASLGARLPYYKFGRDKNPARVRLVRYRLESRYEGAARARIERQVRSWPAGNPDVDAPAVEIESAAVHRNSATLVTRESWRVTAESGRLLFTERNRRHVIHMRRTEGLVLHKWVVTSIA